MVAKNNIKRLIAKANALAKKEKIIGIIYLGAIFVVIFNVAAIMGGVIFRETTDKSACDDIGKEYVNETAYENDLRRSNSMKCGQTTVDRLSSQRSEKLREYAEQHELLSRKREECSSSGFIWRGDKCETAEEADERRVAEEEARARQEEEKTAKLEAAKQECAGREHYTWDGSACLAQTWTKNLAMADMADDTIIVNALFDRMEELSPTAYIHDDGDGYPWSGVAEYAGNVRMKVTVRFHYELMRSRNSFWATAVITGGKAKILELGDK